MAFAGPAGQVDWEVRIMTADDDNEGKPSIVYANPTALNRLFDLRREGKITWRTFGIGVAISAFGGSDGNAWPSRKTLAKIAGITCRNTTAGFKQLEKAGFMIINARPGRPNQYHITPVDFDTCVKNITPACFGQNTPVDSDTGPLSIPTPKEVKKKLIEKLPVAPTAFGEWKAAREAAGKTDPIPGEGNFAAAHKLEELIPDVEERQAIMAAFFRLPDENGWLAGRGHALWQLVHHRLDEARQAAADADRDDNPPELVARIKAGIEERRLKGDSHG